MSFTTPASAQPLPALFQLALAIDPAVVGAQAQVRAAEERVVQARAAFGPSIAATGNLSDTRYTDVATAERRPFHSKQVSLQVTQPLLRVALLPALDGAQAQHGQAQAALEQTRAEAMQRLVEACFGVLKARDNVWFVQAQRIGTTEQLALAQRSFKVGTTPITDVRDAEAKADTVAAQLAAAEFELELRQQVLAELVGQRVADLLARGLDGEQLPALAPASLLVWLADAMERSPQVRQAQQAFESAQAELRKAELAHAPTAELIGNLTRSSESGSTTSIFPRSARSAQVGLNVNVPMFSSGAIQSRVRETQALLDKAQSDVDAARRTVALAVRQSFAGTLSAASQARGLMAAVRSNEVALRANRRGYEVGMKVTAIRGAAVSAAAAAAGTIAGPVPVALTRRPNRGR